MKSIRILHADLSQHFPGLADEINDIINGKEVPVYDSMFKHVLKKEMISFLMSNTDDVADRVADAFTNKYASFGGYSVIASQEQLLFFANFMGCLIQPKQVDEGDVYYRKDKSIVIYVGKEMSYVAFNKAVIDSDKIKLLINRYLDQQSEVISENEAMAVAYRCNYNAISTSDADISSGFSNAAIGNLFLDSFSDGFVEIYYALLAVKSLQEKSTGFCFDGYKNYVYPVLGSISKSESEAVQPYISIPIKDSVLDTLIERQYIKPNFELLEKGRLLLAMHYLMVPLESFGLCGSIKLNSAYISGIIQKSGTYISVGKMNFLVSAWKDEVDSAISELLDGQTPEIPDISEMTKIYPHSERLNAQSNNNGFYGRQYVSLQGELSAWGISLSAFDSMLTVFSQPDSGLFYLSASLFYRTVVTKYPAAEFYTKGDMLYATDKNEIIAFSSLWSEPFSEFAVMTPLPYGGYGNIQEVSKLGLITKSTAPAYQPATISEDDQKQLMSAPVLNVYQLVYSISKKYNNQLNEAELLKTVVAKRKSEFLEKKTALLKSISGAFYALSEAMRDADATDTMKRILNIESSNIYFYKQLLETL